jgi:hypothetical protein
MPLLGFPSVPRHLHASPEERRTVKIKMVSLESCIFGLKQGGLGFGDKVCGWMCVALVDELWLKCKWGPLILGILRAHELSNLKSVR